jgi:hypothetical protein
MLSAGRRVTRDSPFRKPACPFHRKCGYPPTNIPTIRSRRQHPEAGTSVADTPRDTVHLERPQGDEHEHAQSPESQLLRGARYAPVKGFNTALIRIQHEEQPDLLPIRSSISIPVPDAPPTQATR